MIEVEAKFLLESPERLEQQLRNELSAAFEGDVIQQDDYYQHPVRDFRISDEALRLRTVIFSAGTAQYQICYKGPRLDAVTKSRAEMECDLTGDQPTQGMHGLLTALGFTAAGQVRKERRLYRVPYVGREVLVSVDRVDGLPAYAELELVCADADREAATAVILQLADRLNFGPSERRSYLEILQNKG